MNTRQNVPIGDDEQAVVRYNAAQMAGLRTNRRDAIANLVLPTEADNGRPGQPNLQGQADPNRPTTEEPSTIDLTESPATVRPRTREMTMRMNVDRERTVEAMNVEGLGMGVQMGTGGLARDRVDGNGGEEFWNVSGAAAFGL